MKTTIAILLFLATQSSAASSISKAPKRSTLKTEMNFSDTQVKGKYHFANEAIATVEDEKLIHDVLAPRKDFKDRIKEELGN
ncbi:MAG: hypothetical protein KDD25_10110 [Bdellovibrionales bacterium]|nr:hypothetical protein [Bdellovibrionales bacterium]